jgi:large subunit ribosomal protein L25
MMTSRVLRPLARRIQGRHFSADPMENPSKFVTGLSVEDIENNEEISAFMKANFVVDSPQESESAEEEEEVVDDVTEVNTAIALNIRKLTGYLRDTVREEGSRRCQTLRDGGGDVPGLLYGADPTLGIRSSDAASKIFVKTPWSLLQRELDLYHRSFESRVYDLTIFEDESDKEGTVHRVLPTSIQRHPIQHKLFCTNYLRYHAGRPIKIPIAYINEEESPALKRGGFIAPINRFISCLVEEGVPIPDKLELECTGLQMKEVARLNRIIFPDGVSLSNRIKPDKFIIGSVFGRRSGGDDDEEGDAEKKAE